MSGSQPYSVAAVARLLGISERGVRDRIERGTLDAIKEPGQRGWRILLPREAAPDAVGNTASGGSTRGSEAVGGAVVTPAVVEQAITRTGQQYTADLRTMLGELREVYEGQITAKDETIVELRRRAEQAEAERDRLTAAPAVPAAPGATEGPTPDEHRLVAPRGRWARLAAWWRRDGGDGR